MIVMTVESDCLGELSRNGVMGLSTWFGDVKPPVTDTWFKRVKARIALAILDKQECMGRCYKM